ncbi:MAG: MoxR family ATPase [Gammaproteobacteria bacterium]
MSRPVGAEETVDLNEKFQALERHVSGLIIGQEHLVNRMLIALLCDGHLLVEGAPGLAKTRAIKVLSQSIEGDFHRLQFTPDLLPADLTGTEIYRPQDGSFQFRAGPLFHNLILADEINRAPAKVQSALLEAMEERQITVGSKTYPLPKLFMVMATQNPIEQEGTYPLPEAQLDRFLMHAVVGYPTAEDERRILVLNRDEAKAQAADPFTPPAELPEADVMAARAEILRLHLADELERYIVSIVLASRDPAGVDADLAGAIQFGASPRASIAIDRTARAHAWLCGRDYVGPDDIQAVAPDVLRHRILLSYEAEADGLTPDAFIARLLAGVGVP